MADQIRIDYSYRLMVPLTEEDILQGSIERE